jgi:arabinose-5-phosphate isomerase
MNAPRRATGAHDSAPATLAAAEQLKYAAEIIEIEGNTLLSLAKRLDGEFCRAVDLVFRCSGSLIVTGIGKAGLIGQKLAATLASTGTRSHFLHPGEAVHGDLGRIHHNDVVLVLSQSGETEEVVRLLPSLASFGVPVIALTGRAASTLGRAATVVIPLGPLQEACSLGLAPSTSTTAMLAMGDALALVVSRLRDFRKEDFARFHPAGALGRQLAKVEDCMRPLAQCRLARADQTVREVLAAPRPSGRRTGAIMLTDSAGALVGIFTDSDLARLFERRREGSLDGPIRDVMTHGPRTVPQGSRMPDAVAIMAERKLSELPVIDATAKPIGLIDITDVVGLFPEAHTGGLLEAPPAFNALAGGPPRPKHPLLAPQPPQRESA